MHKPFTRPFRLADLMILVAAVAVGFALHRWVNAPVKPGPDRVPGAYGLYSEDAFQIAPMLRASNWFDYLWLRQPSCFAFAATAAIVVLRWCHPHPRAWLVLQEPGAVACMAVVLAMMVGFLARYVELGLQSYDPNSHPDFLSRRGVAWNCAVRWASAAVAGAWAAMALRRRWLPERSWLDRLGRLLGGYWLLGVLLAELFLPFLATYLPIDEDHNP